MYFSNFPNVYIGEGVNDDESFKYRLVKNIFRRIKIRDQMEEFATAFQGYTIKTQETPAIIASRAYGSAHLDWCVLIANNIVDFYTEWPQEEDDLQDFVADKYADPDDVHHYETQEVLYNDIIYMQQGLEVNKTFRVVMPDGTTKTEEESIYPVSNYEHESFINEKKRTIKLPTPGVVDIMQEELSSLLSYEQHSELDTQNNKRTPLNVAARFLNITGYITGSISVTDTLGTVTSYDNGPGSTTIKV
tara:strand:+ start:445 stop:1185 length:741 start_codon:yes stop_codon:yes gene_type:complete